MAASIKRLKTVEFLLLIITQEIFSSSNQNQAFMMEDKWMAYLLPMNAARGISQLKG